MLPTIRGATRVKNFSKFSFGNDPSRGKNMRGIRIWHFRSEKTLSWFRESLCIEAKSRKNRIFAKKRAFFARSMIPTLTVGNFRHLKYWVVPLKMLSWFRERGGCIEAKWINIRIFVGKRVFPRKTPRQPFLPAKIRMLVHFRFNTPTPFPESE